MANYALIIMSLTLGQVWMGTLAASDDKRRGYTKSSWSGARPYKGNMSELGGRERMMMVVGRYGRASESGRVDVTMNGVRIGGIEGGAAFRFLESGVRVGDVVGLWASGVDGNAESLAGAGEDAGVSAGLGMVIKVGRAYWRSGDDGLKCEWGVQREGNWSRQDFCACKWDKAQVVGETGADGYALLRGAKLVWARDAPDTSDVGCRLTIGRETCRVRK